MHNILKYKLLLLVLFVSLLAACSKGSQETHERVLASEYSDYCNEYNAYMELALNLHLTKREYMKDEIYFAAVKKVLERNKLGEVDLGDTLLTRKKCSEINTLLSVFLKNDKKIDAKVLMNQILGAFFAQLDPHSVYYDEEEVESYNESDKGYIKQIGVMFDPRPEYLYGKNVQGMVVTQVVDGQPAFEKLSIGDEIVEINGVSVADKTFRENEKSLKGNLGESVDVKVRRKTQTGYDYFTTAFTRARYVEPITKTEIFVANNNKRVGYLKLRRFLAKSSNAVKHSLDYLIEKQVSGIIFDLRSNPGGHVIEAMKIVDLFVEKGLVAKEIARSDANKYMVSSKISAQNDWIASDEKTKISIPVIVMVNHRSASASELVSGALQSLGAVIVIGEESYGKGIAQVVFSLDEKTNSFFKPIFTITTSRFFFTNGRCPQKVGIIPDIEIADSELLYWMNAYKEKNREAIFREKDWGDRAISSAQIDGSYERDEDLEKVILGIKGKDYQIPKDVEDFQLELAKKYMDDYINLK